MARSNLQIAVGSYVGTGAAQTITAVGFPPKAVMIKADGVSAVWRGNTMVGDSTSHLGATTANITNAVPSLTSNGFYIGTDATVNTNGTTYYWIALWWSTAQNYARTGTYRGTGGNDRSFNDTVNAGIRFQPDFAWISGNRADHKVLRFSTMSGDTSAHFSSTANGADEIQQFLATGFELGTSTRVNASGSEFLYLALKQFAGAIKVGTYTGTGAARTITGVGFQPDIVLTKTDGQVAILKTSSMAGTLSMPVITTAGNTTGITGFASDGFTLGTSSSANGNGSTFHYLALKAGNFYLPISRTAV